MHYSHEFIAEHEVPRARKPMLQHVVDTYASETRVITLARARLAPLAAADEQFWLTEVSFFDVPGTADLPSHRRRQLVRSRSHADSGRGAARPAIMQITGVHLSTVSERGMTCRLTSRGALSSP